MRRYGKSHRARRRVPLTTRAFLALEELPPLLHAQLLFPAPQGGYLEIRNWLRTGPGARAAGVAQRPVSPGTRPLRRSPLGSTLELSR
jgi:hypothetical protein